MQVGTFFLSLVFIIARLCLVVSHAFFFVSALFDFTILAARAGGEVGAARGMGGMVGKSEDCLEG